MSATISIHELSQLRRFGHSRDIVDVRSETEFAAGHIPGAKCIPLQQLPIRHADLGDGYLVLVCEARQHTITCDQPAVNGGFDEGMTPPELSWHH